MSYTYSTYVAALSSALEVDASDVDFVAQIPTIIDLAEQRLYRELDLVDASVAVIGAMTPNNRYFTLPSSSGHILVVDAINVFDAGNTRHPLAPATRDVIDFIWPSDTAPSTSSIPNIFCRPNDDQVLVGPSPGSAWSAEVIATIRPTPLSVSNPTTFLSLYLSDLFFCASMVAATGTLLKNYGAQSDNPQQAVSWETQYNERLISAKSEELRKNYISAMSAPPVSAKA